MKRKMRIPAIIMAKLKILVLFTLVLTLSLSVIAFGNENIESGNTKAQGYSADELRALLWEIPEDADEELFEKLMERNKRILASFKPVITEESYKTFQKKLTQYSRTHDLEAGKEAYMAQDLLELTDPFYDRISFLWPDGSVGPMKDGEIFTEEELDESILDCYGFSPFLIKYLIDDPSVAKGNIIMISGGGFYTRNNAMEGYPACAVFNELGYNTFLLQRRIAPYSPEDIYMDMQRAIRIVRQEAQENGWGGQNCIAAAGFSGGGGTIMGAINACYGYRTPAEEPITQKRYTSKHWSWFRHRFS